MTTRRRAAVASTLAALALVATIVGIRVWTVRAYASRISTSVDEVPDGEPRVAIVLGAGLVPGGGPSPVLYDRVLMATELFKTGRVSKLLFTGDNHVAGYNEPAVMRETALALGVPDDAIVLDYAGRRTYDSCFRAAEIFGVHRAVVVTQRFHLPRALFLCESFGIDAVGMAADRQDYGRGREVAWTVRELVATSAAVVDVHLRRPTPILGPRLPMARAGLE